MQPQPLFKRIDIKEENKNIRDYIKFFRDMGDYPLRRIKFKDDENLGYVESLQGPRTPKIAIFKYKDALSILAKTSIRKADLYYNEESGYLELKYLKGKFRFKHFPSNLKK